MKNLYLFFILSLIKARIIELKDENFENLVNPYQNHPVNVIIFQSLDCPECKDAYKIFEKTLEKVDQNKYKFFKIDCIQNIYTCLRFNITRLPNILILENGFYYQDSNYLTDYSFLSFLNEEKNQERGKSIPDPYSYSEMFFNSLNDIFSMMNRFIRLQIFSLFGVKVQWENYHTIMLILGIILLVTLVEFVILVCCLRKRVPKKIEIDDKSIHSDTDTLKQKTS
jgi:hypothetical protein